MTGFRLHRTQRHIYKIRGLAQLPPYGTRALSDTDLSDRLPCSCRIRSSMLRRQSDA